MNKIETIKAFLAEHGPPDLAPLYGPSMEVQVNVARDEGRAIEGSYLGRNWKGWTDDLTTWKGFRIPRNAKTEPEFTDSPINWNFVKHVEAIGMTGWDWQNRKSMYVAFDFDSIANHNKGLSETEMDNILDIAKKIPYLTVRRSTSGLGLHFYVFFAEPVDTDNHTEHAALARSVLNKLSTQFVIDFNSKVDVCGGVMWIWHRKYETAKAAGLQPFEVLSLGECLYTVPKDWREHIPVIKRVKSKIERADSIGKVASQHSKISLDDDHRKLIEYLGDKGSWSADYNMLTTHTAALMKARRDLEFVGEFDTIATGKDAGDANCFCFPLPNGAWVVRRYSPGCQESPYWSLDSSGWTRCFFNRKIDFTIACRIHGGLNSKKGIEFPSGRAASAALEQLGAPDLIPQVGMNRPTRLSIERIAGSVTSNIMIEIERTSTKETTDVGFQGYIPRPKFWERTITLTTEEDSSEITNHDDLVRHTISESNENIGWMLYVNGMGWVREPVDNARLYFQGKSFSPPEISKILGGCTSQPWKIVTKPFQPEYPGNREWNRNAAQLKYVPLDVDEPEHPTWDTVLEHLGNSLTPYLSDNEWAKENNVVSGADYLTLWMASVIKQPLMPLPYLFFWGQQLSGKSTFHEAFDELLTGGIQRAGLALQDKFNAEIGNAVVCVIEELDLSERKDIYNKIKDYVTSQKIQIRPMYQSPYMIANSTHWIQVANDRRSCPTFPGDTRVTYVYVGEIQTLIPRTELFMKLREEAPAFLCRLLKIEIPPCRDRLGIPVLETLDKTEAMAMNQSNLESFLNERYTACEGNVVTFSMIYDDYVSWCANTNCNPESKVKASQNWPQHKFPKGHFGANILSIGNIKRIESDCVPNGKVLKMDASGRLIMVPKLEQAVLHAN